MDTSDTKVAIVLGVGILIAAALAAYAFVPARVDAGRSGHAAT